MKCKILDLLNNSSKIKYFKKEISITKKKFIKTWNKRVDEEEDILKKIVLEVKE